MRLRIAERGGPALAILGRLFHALPNEYETTIETRGDPSSRGPSLLTPRAPLEAPVPRRWLGY